MKPMSLVLSLEQLVDSIKDDVARVEAELKREEDPIQAAELRGELRALRRISVPIGGLIRAEADAWKLLEGELS